MKITAAIVNYNGSSYLKNCLDALLAQTHPPEEIVVVDNDSTDDSLTILKNYASKIRLIKTGENIGFAGGANRAIRSSRFPYLLLMNPDVVVTPSFIENLLQFAENHPEAGSLTGKLLRFSAPESLVIDSTGHQLLRSRWVINRGEEEIDHGQYELAEEIFGVCGAAAFYRRAMLEDIRVNEEFLDEDFFLYLEDVDLDWRARLKGWKAYYVPKALGYHQRGYLNVFQSQNTAVLRHCLKNRYLMMIKNDFLGDIFLFKSDSKNNYILIVSDNGIGLPKNFEFTGTETLGLQLVKSLVNQHDAEIEFNRNGGTEITITFLTGND